MCRREALLQVDWTGRWQGRRIERGNLKASGELQGCLRLSSLFPEIPSGVIPVGSEVPRR